uniref:Uncharacterized protein n=1 Tax=Cacopsylla melanoneura TaxID=428564 RepID=A0A8D8TZC3_9HEMI
MIVYSKLVVSRTKIQDTNAAADSITSSPQQVTYIFLAITTSTMLTMFRYFRMFSFFNNIKSNKNHHTANSHTPQREIVLCSCLAGNTSWLYVVLFPSFVGNNILDSRSKRRFKLSFYFTTQQRSA